MSETQTKVGKSLDSISISTHLSMFLVNYMEMKTDLHSLANFRQKSSRTVVADKFTIVTV